MKYAIIDVGSNSVRLLLSDSGRTILKTSKITKLAEKMQGDNFLKIEMVERTVQAVSFFVDYAKGNGYDKVFVFATEAVRKAKNKDYFCKKVFELTGINVDVISGEQEANIGLNGVFNNKDGAIIDIGGASTEVCVRKNGKIIISESIDIGAVKLFDLFKTDKDKMKEFINVKLKDLGKVESKDFYCVGGTCLNIASVLNKIKEYKDEKVNGYRISYRQIKDITEKFFSLNDDERKEIVGLQKERVKTISAGSLILLSLFEFLSIDNVTVSTNDNLEGYLLKVMENENI